jgi:hypothetical protein
VLSARDHYTHILTLRFGIMAQGQKHAQDNQSHLRSLLQLEVLFRLAYFVNIRLFGVGPAINFRPFLAMLADSHNVREVRGRVRLVVQYVQYARGSAKANVLHFEKLRYLFALPFLHIVTYGDAHFGSAF